MTDLAPSVAVTIQNDSGMDIPPNSAVVVTSVEYTSGDSLTDPSVIHHVTQYVGQAGNILITGDTTIPATVARTGSASSAAGWSPTKSYGRAYADSFLYAAVDPTISGPTVGEQWGPKSGAWYLTRGGSGFFAEGSAFQIGSSASSVSSSAIVNANSVAIFLRGNAAGTGGCGCCDCFDCLSSTQATVAACAGAPNGAAFQYLLPMGVTPFSDNGGTSDITTFTYGTPVCPSSSSASSSSSSSSGTCIWYSCPATLCQPSSSSSSSSGACGVYQLTLVMTLDVSGQTVESFYLHFISGTDWAMAGS